MTLHTPKLASLIASRICHDLISPVGAISNGLELMGLGGVNTDGPEMSLISDSCASANARIRMFRIAFGLATDVARVSETECRGILDGLYTGTRVSVSWNCSGDMSRQEVQLAFLALQCLETTIPHGGRITIAQDDTRWTLVATGERINPPGHAWDEMAALSDHPPQDGSDLHFSPSEVQFAMLPLMSQAIGRAPAVTWSATKVVLTV